MSHKSNFPPDKEHIHNTIAAGRILQTEICPDECLTAHINKLRKTYKNE